MKKTFLIGMLLGAAIVPINTFAQTNNDYEIIPEATDPSAVIQAVSGVGAKGGSVWDVYNKEATAMSGKVGDQLASGIMTWDTLLDYIVYLVRFLSQIGIVIGVVMIIYAGYLYATSVFSSGNMGKGKTAIINAIIGVLIVTFSYAIMKLLTSAFLS